jgi:predicted alpha/beta superfamily hydrolase
MKLLSTICSFLLFTQVAYSQIKTEKKYLEYNVIELESDYFSKQKRIVKIFLPNNYDRLKKHPVIYTLDGSTLFDLTSNYVAQLSKLTIEDEYDVATDAIPQSIVVGVFHNDRGYETEPNFSNYSNSDTTVFLEGSEKLKNFLFKELVPYIDSNYTTSGYNSIIGHSNTAHFVMSLLFQKHNPFKGIISVSLTGDSEKFKNKVKIYLEKNLKTNMFIGYGTKDFDFNEFAKKIKTESDLDNLKVGEFNGNHGEMPALSLVTGIKHIFREYRNIDEFTNEASKKNFEIKQYLEEYQTKNKQAYGITTKIKEDDFYSLYK